MNIDRISDELSKLKDEIKNAIFNGKTKRKIVWMIARTLDNRLCIIDDLLYVDIKNNIKKALGDNVFVRTRNLDTMIMDDFKLASKDDELISAIDEAVSTFNID